MNRLDSFNIEVWRDSDGNGRACLNFTFPQNEDGFNRLSFYLSNEEVCNFFSGKYSSAQDIYNIMTTCGDTVNIVNYDVPSCKLTGKLEGRFASFFFPVFARRVVMRQIERMWKRCNNSESRLKLTLSKKTMDRWVNQYGQGSGQVKFEMNDTTRQFLEQSMCPNLKSRLEYLGQIARNTTNTFFKTASVRLSKDWDGFNWSAHNPKGSCVMNGGLINHGKETPDWSIHT